MSLLIKIGTSTITNKIGEIDSVILKNIVSQVAYLHKQNKEIVLVTSGAVACGKHILATTCCNNNNDNNQSSFLSLRSQAAIGQPYLINSYNQEFIKHNIISAQVLLQDIDFRELDRVNSIKDVIKSLTSKGIIPILNENDATTIRKQDYRDGEGKILWDNDSLATLVAKAISCDSLILLSNIDGVIDISGNLIRVWDDNYFKTLGNLEDSGYGRGGILSKIKAASQAAEHGIDTFIINGKVPDILLSNELTGVRGTHFRVHQKSFISSRLNISNNSNKLDKSNKATSILKVIKNAKEN